MIDIDFTVDTEPYLAKLVYLKLRFTKNVIYIRNNLDKNIEVKGIFFNVEKTFDYLNIKYLKKKLRYCGLRGKIYYYLNDRTQIFKINIFLLKH